MLSFFFECTAKRCSNAHGKLESEHIIVVYAVFMLLHAPLVARFVCEFYVMKMMRMNMFVCMYVFLYSWLVHFTKHAICARKMCVVCRVYSNPASWWHATSTHSTCLLTHMYLSRIKGWGVASLRLGLLL